MITWTVFNQGPRVSSDPTRPPVSVLTMFAMHDVLEPSQWCWLAAASCWVAGVVDGLFAWPDHPHCCSSADPCSPSPLPSPVACPGPCHI